MNHITGGERGKATNKEGVKTADMAPILSLLSAVRKSIRSFVGPQGDKQEARSVMMKVFCSFDPHSKGRLSCRDFSFAVSVLMNDILRDCEEATLDVRSARKNVAHSPPSKKVPWRTGVRSSNVPNSSAVQSLALSKGKNTSDGSRECEAAPTLLVLSDKEWNAVFQYFSSSSSPSPSPCPSSQPDTDMDYALFCDSVLQFDEPKREREKERDPSHTRTQTSMRACTSISGIAGALRKGGAMSSSSHHFHVDADVGVDSGLDLGMQDVGTASRSVRSLTAGRGKFISENVPKETPRNARTQRSNNSVATVGIERAGVHNKTFSISDKNDNYDTYNGRGGMQSCSSDRQSERVTAAGGGKYRDRYSTNKY